MENGVYELSVCDGQLIISPYSKRRKKKPPIDLWHDGEADFLPKPEK